MNGRRQSWLGGSSLGLGLMMAGALSAASADPVAASPESPATLRVTGLGWWKNRELRQTLRLLEPEAARLTRLDAALIEDAVVLLQSALEREGYLESSGEVRLQRAGEELGEFAWVAGDVPRLPRELVADEARFVLEPGVRYHIHTLTFTGLTAFKHSRAREYFVEEGFLFDGRSTRRFTPGGLRNGVASLREQLVRMGYSAARVTVAEETRDDANGRVDLTMAVEQGALHHVGTVTPPENLPTEVAGELRAACATATGGIDSPLWRQDFVQAARALCFVHGYANAEVKLLPEFAPAVNGTDVRTDFHLVVLPGPQVRVGSVTFGGDERTKHSVLRRATTVDPGELFDRRHVDEDRQRLGALGAFRAVQAVVDPVAPDLWNLTYDLRPAKRMEVSLLAGYGSYEGLRGGIEMLHTNLLGRAHRGRLQLILAEKAAHGDYLYTLPQIFGTSADLSTRVFGLQRKEVSFDRDEFGVSVGARRRITWLGADAALRYQFESVTAEVFDPARATDAPTDSNVASLTLDLSRDRLDNPIAPRHGHFIALSLETATKAFGGEVDYQRLDFRAAWHRPVGRNKFVHFGFRHGLVWAMTGSSALNVPLARRYFPGGEGTVRGYTEGRASPRTADGTFVGAEVSTIVNVEFEQGLAKNLSGVIFVDAGLSAARFGDYPGDQTRVSVGLGLRYNSVIGPARLEYGRNVVRESGDGSDAWHLSLGFPF